VLSACGGGADEPPVEPAATEESSASNSAAIYSLAIDPGDGTMLLTAGPSLYRLAPGATELEQLGPTMSTPEGQGPVQDLVLRFTEPGKLIASGHAQSPLPQNLGLIRSDDAAATWDSVSGLNEADYHELEIAKDQIVGLRSDVAGVQVSDDGGKTFETYEPPADTPPIDVAMNPDDVDHMALSSQQGVFISTNGGRSWRQRDTTSATRLAWAAVDALYSAGLDGKIRLSSDGGRSWSETGTIGAGPKEFIAGPKDELFAVIAPGEIQRSSDGGATWDTVAKVP
jgi:hypothetical protein